MERNRENSFCCGARALGHYLPDFPEDNARKRMKEFEDTGASTHNMCELIIGKQRNGPTGTSRLTFLKEFGKFGDPDLFHDSGAMPVDQF